MAMRILKPEATAVLRRDLRTAVTSFVAGEESLASIHHQIERIAKYVAGKQITLGQAKCCMMSLVADTTPEMLEETGLPGWNFTNLYDSVTDARNDLAHTGTAARLADTRTVALAQVLMEALVTPDNSTTADKIMVSNPVCAQSWQTLADVRRTMLMHDYSALPIKKCGRWKLLHAKDLGVYLLTDRRERMRRMREALCSWKVPLKCVQTVCRSTRIECFLGKAPVLVTKSGRDDDELLGIVTAFDLL